MVGQVTSGGHGVTVNWTEVGVIVAALALLVTVLSLVGIRGATLSKFKTDIEYLRRDVDTMMRYFKLVPAAEQDRRKRRLTTWHHGLVTG